MYYKQRFLAVTCLLGPSHEHIKSLQLLDTGKVVNLQPKNLTAKKPDMDPTDMSCIYSTLHFVAAESHRQGTTPMLTFDQPLYWKAKTIIVHEKEGSELKPIVLNLGGFHSVVSFLGCMGHVMEASGLKEVLELIYAENAVTQMLSGKAYARAIRGHFLVDTALSSIVLGRAYGVNLSMVDEESDACKDFQEAADLLDKCCVKTFHRMKSAVKTFSTEFLKNLKLRRAP